MTQDLIDTAANVSSETGQVASVGQYVRHVNGNVSTAYVVEIGDASGPKFVSERNESLTKAAIFAMAEWKHKSACEARRLAERLRSMGHEVTLRTER